MNNTPQWRATPCSPHSIPPVTQTVTLPRHRWPSMYKKTPVFKQYPLQGFGRPPNHLEKARKTRREDFVVIRMSSKRVIDILTENNNKIKYITIFIELFQERQFPFNIFVNWILNGRPSQMRVL